jgi:hypothetical protein
MSASAGSHLCRTCYHVVSVSGLLACSLTAFTITTDAYASCSQGVGDLFPALQVGYILTRLFGAVELPLEQLRFEDVVAELAAAQRPHTLELMRYDYQRNVLTGKWESLAQLRAAGRFLQDPRQEAMHFVDACKRGVYILAE